MEKIKFEKNFKNGRKVVLHKMNDFKTIIYGSSLTCSLLFCLKIIYWRLFMPELSRKEVSGKDSR